LKTGAVCARFEDRFWFLFSPFPYSTTLTR